MSFTEKIKYKPFINENSKKLLDSYALANVLEFRSMNVKYYLKNYIEAFRGNYTGPYSEFREKQYDSFPVCFNEEKKYFEALPTSLIYSNNGFRYPLPLYSSNNVGTILNPEKVEFLIVQPNGCNNTTPSKDYLAFQYDNFVDDEEIKKINLGKNYKIIPNTDRALIPINRSDEEKIALKKLFYKLPEVYSGGHKEFSSSFNYRFTSNRNKYSEQSGDTYSTLMSEIIINAPTESHEAIIIHTTNKDSDIGYKPFDKGFMFDKVDGIMLAALIKISLKDEGIDLPIIHYHNPMSDIEKIEQPVIREVHLEMDKVRSVLKDDDFTKNFFVDILGAEFTNKIIDRKKIIYFSTLNKFS